MEVGLNSPRGKFKITIMADDLAPEDIPLMKKREKLTVAQLKFWFKCHRINQDGHKKELLERYVYIIWPLTRSISCLCPLFSTTSLHSGLDTCFHTKLLSQGHETTSKEKS